MTCGARPASSGTSPIARQGEPYCAIGLAARDGRRPRRHAGAQSREPDAGHDHSKGAAPKDEYRVLRILRSEGIRRMELLGMVMHMLPADVIPDESLR
jgi:hypothetical protein